MQVKFCEVKFLTRTPFHLQQRAKYIDISGNNCFFFPSFHSTDFVWSETTPTWNHAHRVQLQIQVENVLPVGKKNRDVKFDDILKINLVAVSSIATTLCICLFLPLYEKYMFIEMWPTQQRCEHTICEQTVTIVQYIVWNMKLFCVRWLKRPESAITDNLHRFVFVVLLSV